MSRVSILTLATAFALTLGTGHAQDMGGGMGSDPAPAAEPAKNGTISGTIKWDGDVPKGKKLNSQMEGDKYCGAQHTDTVWAEDVVIDKDSKAFANVFVHVKKGAPKADAPKTPVKVDQKGCQYFPHVVGVVIGQELQFVNSDDTMHNVHALPQINKEFNKGQGTKGATDGVTFTTPELSVKVKCDVHPWMGAWIHVVEHPFFAVSGKDGKYQITGLPDGEYEIEAIHEKFGKQSATVKVASGAATQDFTFKKS